MILWVVEKNKSQKRIGFYRSVVLLCHIVVIKDRCTFAYEPENEKVITARTSGNTDFSALNLAMCSQICPADKDILDLRQKSACSLSTHFFGYLGIHATGLFMLPFLGLFLLAGSIGIPSGFRVFPFRPPRFTA